MKLHGAAGAAGRKTTTRIRSTVYGWIITRGTTGPPPQVLQKRPLRIHGGSSSRRLEVGAETGKRDAAQQLTRVGARWRRIRPLTAARQAIVVLLLATTLASCVSAADSAADYEEKVANAAEAARSSVETAGLVITAVEEGKAPGPYTSSSLSDVEQAVGTVATQLSAVHPPTDEAMKLRNRVTTLLTESHTLLSELRIAAHNGDYDYLSALGDRLPALSARLRNFQQLRPT